MAAAEMDAFPGVNVTEATRAVGRRVALIVEDQASMRAALRDFLGMALPAWQVVHAVDGTTTMRVFNEHHPVLVLMDVCLPDGSGIELTRRIKEMAPETVVVVMSIQTGAHIVEQALAAGAAGAIGKDRVFTELAPLIARLNLPASRL